MMSVDGHDKIMGFQNNTIPIYRYCKKKTTLDQSEGNKQNSRISGTVVF